jgi:hypothetical protein
MLKSVTSVTIFISEHYTRPIVGSHLITLWLLPFPINSPCLDFFLRGIVDHKLLNLKGQASVPTCPVSSANCEKFPYHDKISLFYKLNLSYV